MDPQLKNEKDFVGREDFFEELDKDWRGNTRLFGIFGLRSVGKTRTAFEFIRRKIKEIRESENGVCTRIKPNVGNANTEETKHDSDTNTTVEQEVPTNKNVQGQINIIDEINKVVIHRTAKHEPIKILYVDLRLFKDLGSFSSQLFAQLGMQSKITSENDCVFQLIRAIKTLTSPKNVLFFDNAEDAIEGILDFSLQDISTSLIQNCSSVRIVVTATTNAKFANVWRAFKKYELPPMSKVDSSKFLRVLAPDVDFGEHFDRIVALCTGLPLAIMLVAAELFAGTGSDKMVKMLAECRIEALSKEGHPDEQIVDAVYRKFIERLARVFRDRLAVLNYIPGSFNVWEAGEMLGQETIARAKQEIVVPLRDRNFLQNAPTFTEDQKERRFDIHGIIRECLSLFFEIKNMPEVRKLYCKTFVTVMKDISRQMGTRDYASAVFRFTVEHPNLQQLLTDVFYSNEDTYQFYMEVVGSCSDIIEKFMASQGERFYKACLGLATDNGQDGDIITVKIALGSMQTNAKGEFSHGFKTYQEALSLAENFPPSQKVAKVYQKLGFNMYLQGWGEDGLSYLKRSLEITSQLGRQETEDFLSTMASLGIVYSFLGRFEEAERCHLAILNRRKRKQGEDHPAIGKQLNNLGIMYEQKGDIQLARQYFEEGLAKKKSTKTEPVSIVNSLSNVARQCADMGDFIKAESLLNEALALLQEKNVNNVSAIGLINNSFGKIYLKKGDFERSINHMKESIRIKRTTMQSESSPFFVNPLLLLARGYIGCENYGAAINRLNQVLALKNPLIEKLPQNDLVYQCYDEMLKVHKALKNEKLIVEIKTEMGTELFRLADYFESKGNETKAKSYREKLDKLRHED